MVNALVIVWRESLEAMLVVGVLLAWIGRQPEPGRLRQGLWWGVAAGLVLAVLLGLATFAAQSEFAGASLEIFQLAMVLFAAGLIVQMVFWMHRHGRHMKRELEAQAAQTQGALGIALVTALSVAREGGETVVFLYGLGMEGSSGHLWQLLGAATAGIALAAATAWLVARGARFLNYRTLFRISEILLLIIANALLNNGIDRLVSMDWLPPLQDPAWDVSFLLDDTHGVGRLLADFAGYRARPSGALLLATVGYWFVVLWRFSRLDGRPEARS